MVVEFTGRQAVLTSDRPGPAGAVARVVGVVARAMADGTWARLKACANDECEWAFYDHSRSRTRRWCSMELCGNRAEQTRWRDRRG
ncbi:CGNR zinc finger domain-containing protein [Nonomuraea spiralis]|uniref:CGNR zinc finger domain-containing protein n=1 Tax=Nonomuraea spiralis TaxID=46182 RepID=UPI0037917509